MDNAIYSTMPPLKGLPVFVFPQSIKFYVNDQSSHKQVLTLYNPYDFRINFQVCLEKSARRDKYNVVESEGTVKAKCCVDIVIRHLSAVASNCNVVDRFSVDIEANPSRQFSGRQIITAVLLNSKECVNRGVFEKDLFQHIPKTKNDNIRNTSFDMITTNKSPNGGTNYVAVLAGILCIIGLLLPTEIQRNPFIPECLHLSVNLRLVLAFVLGMCTIIILRI